MNKAILVVLAAAVAVSAVYLLTSTQEAPEALTQAVYIPVTRFEYDNCVTAMRCKSKICGTNNRNCDKESTKVTACRKATQSCQQWEQAYKDMFADEYLPQAYYDCYETCSATKYEEPGKMTYWEIFSCDAECGGFFFG